MGTAAQIARAHSRWGWRTAYWLLRSEGLVVNCKRIRRYWADEGLPRPARVCKRQRIGPQRGDRLAATCPDQGWRWTFRSTSLAMADRSGSAT